MKIDAITIDDRWKLLSDSAPFERNIRYIEYKILKEKDKSKLSILYKDLLTAHSEFQKYYMDYSNDLLMKEFDDE